MERDREISNNVLRVFRFVFLIMMIVWELLKFEKGGIGLGG